MIKTKEIIREKRGGKNKFPLQISDTIVFKVRRSKDKPRHQEAQACSKPLQNIVPVFRKKSNSKLQAY